MWCEGYIKIHRKLTVSRVFSHEQDFAIWLFLLLSAEWKKKQYYWGALEPGEVLCSHQDIMASTGLAKKQIYNSICRLTDDGMLTSTTQKKRSVLGTGKNSQIIFKITNWSKYQDTRTRASQDVQEIITGIIEEPLTQERELVGFIRAHRAMLASPVMAHPTALRTLFYLWLNCNYVPKEVRGNVLAKAGEALVNPGVLGRLLAISKEHVMVALRQLASWGFVKDDLDFNKDILKVQISEWENTQYIPAKKVKKTLENVRAKSTDEPRESRQTADQQTRRSEKGLPFNDGFSPKKERRKERKNVRSTSPNPSFQEGDLTEGQGQGKGQDPLEKGQEQAPKPTLSIHQQVPPKKRLGLVQALCDSIVVDTSHPSGITVPSDSPVMQGLLDEYYATYGPAYQPESREMLALYAKARQEPPIPEFTGVFLYRDMLKDYYVPSESQE